MTPSSNQQTSGQAPQDGVGAPQGQLTAGVAYISYALCCLTFILVVTRVNNYWEMSRTHGDNGAYLTIAQATVEGRFSGADLQEVRKFYRGTGYCVALVSLDGCVRCPMSAHPESPLRCTCNLLLWPALGMASRGFIFVYWGRVYKPGVRRQL